MKTLGTHYTKSGWGYLQIAREGDVAIYHREKGKIQDWEVILIQSHNGYSVAGKDVEPAEFYPSSEAWGTHGWTYTTEANARAKMAALLAEREVKA